MTLDAFQRSLRAFERRRPFKAFEIELLSGDRIRVTHPEAVSFRGDVIIYESPSSSYRLFQSVSVCQLLDLA